MAPVTVEPTKQKIHGPCQHCGGSQQTVWGWIHLGGATRAAYYVRWTAGHREQGMVLFVCVGRWEDQRYESERESVGVACRFEEGRPRFMIVDAATTPWGVQRQAVFGRLLERAEAVGGDVAREVFGYIDLLLIKDPRVARFVATGKGIAEANE